MVEPIRILVADEDRLIRGILKDTLAGTPNSITAVRTGKEAVDAIQDATYHLVITDLKMPDVDGLDLLHRVHEDSPDTVVVIMTGEGSIKETVALMKAGAHDVISKPFEAEEMQLVVEKALKHQSICRHNEELKEKLATSEKLAVIGRLAAGVAHELNNPLDGVLRFVNLSIERLPEENDVRQYLAEARTGLNRMADIVKSLLRFSRNIVIENEPRSIDEMIHDAISQVQHANRRANIEMRCVFEEPDLYAPVGMMQVFNNLIKNACDAMRDEERGLLEIRASVDEGITTIEFKDNGCGISDADTAKVFEPFYTTKEIGKGTGLGLSICARIVEKFHGTLSFESTPGVGTTFVVRFPSVQPDGNRSQTASRA